MGNSKQLNKLKWNEAAKAGLILGGSLSVIYILSYFTHGSFMDNAWGSIEFVTLAAVMFLATKRYGRLRGELSFTQALSFVILLTFFSGIITGIASYLMRVWIAPEYYDNLYYEMINQAYGANAQPILELYKQYGHNLSIIMLSTMAVSVMQGAFLGLIVAAFTRSRNPFGYNK